MRKQNKNRLYKIITVLGVIFLILFVVIVYLLRSVNKSGFFKIKNIVVRLYDPVTKFDYLLPPDKMDLSYLKGRDIISIDLQKEQDYLSRVYPGYRRIKLVRILPDKLFADFLVRKPIAYVKLYRKFCIDDDLVLFDFPDQEGLSDLPVIIGLETKIFGPKPGTKYNFRELASAVEIIMYSSRNNYLKNIRIIKIDMSDLSNASFFLEVPDNLKNRRKKPCADFFEVKIGQDSVNDKINLLSSLLAQSKNDFADIKYIDLRFKEPVIRLKDNL
ncbi:MAG: hypothetical protein ABIH18_04360 [Candidatus Omnitrophota bacterium]